MAEICCSVSILVFYSQSILTESSKYTHTSQAPLQWHGGQHLSSLPSLAAILSMAYGMIWGNLHQRIWWLYTCQWGRCRIWKRYADSRLLFLACFFWNGLYIFNFPSNQGYWVWKIQSDSASCLRLNLLANFNKADLVCETVRLPSLMEAGHVLRLVPGSVSQSTSRSWVHVC